MSYTLGQILAEASEGSEITVTLSAESVAVLLYGAGFLDKKRNWLDTQQDPMDEITAADWDAIEALVAKLIDEVYTPVTTHEVGEYKMLSHSTVPSGWLLCRGAVVAQADYPTLYAVIGGLYDTGGEGEGNFRLPDFSHRSPMGAPSNEFIGARGGSLTQTLIGANLPPHNHQLQNNAGSPAYRHTGVAGARASLAATNGTTNSTAEMVTENEGLAEPFSIIHPVLYANVIIYAGTDNE